MEEIKLSAANLKIIEMQIINFKSIAGRKVFKDLTNFNCVIGPNGCGKSNFLDALSFVLGEKASKLRVKKLDDLIHGSTIGSPVVKTASVEATFTVVNNATAEEEMLIFTRIIKHSSCIYNFNNKAVNKEEYLSKLKEYGMNVEFPNFLIYQGSIAEIALQNPVELRRYFEYIAGSTNIVKEYEELTDEYKTLRGETQTLLNEKNNMNKVVKNAMGTRDEYKIYLEAKNQYDDKMRLKELICLFCLDKAIKSLTEKCALGEKHSSNLNGELEALKRDLLEKRRQQKDGSRDVAESDEVIQNRQADLNKMKLCILKSKETLNNAAKKVKDCKQHIEKNNEDVKASDKTIVDVLTKIKTAEENQKRCKITSVSEEDKSQYRSLKQEAALIHGKTFNIHNEEREDQADNDIIDTLKTELKALQSYIKISEAGKKNCSERITKLNEKLTEYNTSEDQRKIDGNTLTLLNERIKSIEERLIEEGNVQMNIEEHKHDERRKNVLRELKHTFKGVFERVSNCCSVNKDKYKIPLTKVIGMKNMNAIIVDNEGTAQRCIKYLKMQKYAPETFLPISFVKVRPYKSISTTSRSAAVLLKNILIFDEKYDNIMSFVCKGTYVCENEQTLKVLYEQKINVVNLEGSYYQSSGLISGGVTDLARKAHQWTTKDESEQQERFAKLKEEHATLKQQLLHIYRHKDVAFDTKQVETIIGVVNEDIKETENEVRKFDAKITKQKNDIKKIMNQMGILETKVTNRETILNEVNENISIIFQDFCKNLEIANVAEFDNMEQQKIDVDNELNRFQMELDYAKKFKNILKENKTDLQKQLSECEKQHKAAIEDQDTSAKNFSSTSFTVEEVKKDRDNKLKKLQEVDSNAGKISKNHSDLLKNCEAARNAQIKLKNDIITHKKQFNTEFVLCIVEGIEIPLIQSQGSEDIQLDHYSNVIIDYNQIPENYCRYADIKDKNFRKLLDNLVEEINKLRLKAESGSRYLSKHGIGRNKYIETLREKLEAKEKQYEESVKRYHTVTEKIKKLTQIRNDRLINLLNYMKTIIKPMYSDLTGDITGNVFLQFENAEKPFEGGITYNIIVPEKTFMSLDSLSGGEITLAGILLVLAIQRYSRCPILILDEIDAPLDRLNAIKLFKYLGKINADLQIFLITHNAEVYVPVELLIGFTKKCMQEAILKSKAVMLSCENYQQISTFGILHESDVSF